MSAPIRAIRFLCAGLLGATLVFSAGCKQKVQSEREPTSTESAVSTSGVSARTGSQLAYKIDLQITLPAELIATRLEALRLSCEAQATVQSCSLLSIEQQQEQGSIEMRAAPAAIERLTSQATENGKVMQRNVKADDLTQALDDNALNTDSLTLQHKKFSALLSRPDLNVSDAITLARELSNLEAAAQTAARERGLMLRRIETNFLRVSFTGVQANAPAPSFWQNFSAAFAGFDVTLAEALSETILVLVYVLPLIFAMFPVALIWRWLWRKLTGKNRVLSQQS